MFTSKGWGQSRPRSPVEGHSPQPPPAPPLPPRDRAARGREALGREGAGGGSNKDQRPAGARGLRVRRDPPALPACFPSLLTPTAGARCLSQLGVETAAGRRPRPQARHGPTAPAPGGRSRPGPARPAAPQPFPAAFPGNPPPPCPGA